MTPLLAILNWWESLEDFPRDYIASEVCFRLTSHADIMGRHRALFQEFLREELPANRHVGRTVAVRAVIDFYFMRNDLDDSLHSHLESVELSVPNFRRLANDAIGRHSQIAPGWYKARDTWHTLKAATISDTMLVSLERDAILSIFRSKI
jgi:hypothetical protein